MQPKKISVIIVITLGGFILSGLIIRFSLPTVIASEPASVPADNDLAQTGPSDTLCHLAQGKDCTFINPLDMAISSASMRLNPAMASKVPTYTLISIVFERDLDVTTLNPDTFYLSQGNIRVKGSIDYINSGKMAIFYPDKPLELNRIYTATIRPDIRDHSGISLTGGKVWTFTTVAVMSDLTAAANLVAAAGMNIYFGDLHGHTAYSDGAGTPAAAFAMAKASGLDFFGLTEHAFFVTDDEWQDVINQAQANTFDGQFIALPGFEYTHGSGHINIFGSDTYIHRDDPDYDTLDKFYSWLVAHPTAIGQFNHPGDHNANFKSFAYQSAVDHKIVLQELTIASQFFLALNSGWHLGTLKNRDTHIANWGCCPLMGVVAFNLTPESILEALAAKRTFFVSPSDSNLALVMQANGRWMGSAIPNSGTINFTINAYDPDPGGRSLRMYLYDNGQRVAATTLPANTSYSWSPSRAAQLGHYYYVEAYYDGWAYPAYSSPIWVERNPVAEAGPAQIEVPNTPITLDGRQSWDPDGSSLAYRWDQASGPAVTLLMGHSAQPMFTTSLTGTYTFQLKVSDVGSLSSFDTTSVTLTDKPILAISKSGPSDAEPHEFITYTLTIANNGLSDARGVVITDVLPYEATYITGGTLMPTNVVSWFVPYLATGSVTQVTFVVTTSGILINDNYRADCAACIPAVGRKAVVTNRQDILLPIILKSQ